MLSLGIGPGDEVIVPAFTFFASISAVLQTGAKPVLADIGTDSYTLNPEKTEALINSNTKVIMPVHLYGIPARMTELTELATQYHLNIVEDFAQSVGAFYNNNPAGSIGKINGSSFYPVKNLGALGDGGIITTNDPDLAEFCRVFRNYGSPRKYEFEKIGVNSRLDELQAAFLLVKLKYLDRWLKEKNKIALRYFKNLKGLQAVKFFKPDDLSIPAWHIFPICCEERDKLQQFLKQLDIETLIHYPIPPYRQPALQFLNCSAEKFPESEKIASKELSLPIYPGLQEDKIDYICEKIIEFYHKPRR